MPDISDMTSCVLLNKY